MVKSFIQDGALVREKNSATVFDHLPLPGGFKIGDLNNGELANVLIPGLPPPCAVAASRLLWKRRRTTHRMPCRLWLGT